MAENNVKFTVEAEDKTSWVLSSISRDVEKLWKISSSNFQKISKETTKTSNSISDFWNNFKSTFAWIGAYDIVRKIISSFAWIWKETIKLAANLEQTQIAFTTMTWSAKIADAFIREMVDFAKKTPFEISSLEESSKRLLAFWFDIEKVIPTLKILWDISAWIWTDKLPNLITALWQVQAKTRLMGQELLQFTEAWVPLLEELTKVTWQSALEVQNMISKWQIWFPLVEKALNNLTKEWWRFFNLMENQSKTFSWMVSNFKDTLTIMLRDLWTLFLPDLKKLLWKLLEYWNTNWKQVSSSVSALITSLVWFFAEWFSWIASIIDTTFTFFRSKNKSSIDNSIISFKWFLLVFGLGLDAIRLAIKTAWAFFVSKFTEAFFSIQINFLKLQKFFGEVWNWISLISTYVWAKIWEAFVNWARKAVGGINSIIDWLNSIPWVNISRVWKSLWEVTNLTFENIKDLNKNSLGAFEEYEAKIISLELQKSETLKWINESTADIINEGINWMTQKYDDFVNSGKQTAGAWETLEEVLNKIWKNKTDIANNLWLWSSWDWWNTKKSLNEAEKAASELKEEIENLNKKTKSSLEGVFKDLIWDLDKQKSKITSLKEEYIKLKETLKTVWENGEKELEKINQALEKQKDLISELESNSNNEVAQRALDIEKEISEIKNNKTIDEKEKQINSEKLLQLETELALATAYAGNEIIEKQRLENAKSETEKIIEKNNLKILEAEEERNQIQLTYAAKEKSINDEKLALQLQIQEKKALIIEEFSIYKWLVEQRKKIEEDYFSTFHLKINRQIDKTKQAIELLNKLNEKKALVEWEVNLPENTEARAEWWPVVGGRPYLVWERGPEIFTPSSSWNIIPNNQLWWINVSINMGWVNVNNRQDIDSLADVIINKITRQLQLQKLWIS